MKRIALIGLIALMAAGLVHAAGYVTEQDMARGTLIDAVAFENGDSATVTMADLPGTGMLALHFAYAGDGLYEQAWSNTFPYDRVPDTIFVSACGGWLHVHAGWTDGGGDIVRAYRWELPRKVHASILPLVCR